MTQRILFISKGENSASTRYRALQFFPLLHQAGYAARHATISGSPANYLRALYLARQSDIVVVLRKTFPRPMLWLLRRLSRKLIFDFDDAIFCNSDGSASATRMRRFAAMAATCDHILAGNRFLAATVLRFNSAVTLTPTSVDTGRYVSLHEKPKEFIDLVWIGSHSTRKYLVEVLPALRQAATRVPNLRLKIVADFQLTDAGLTTLAVPWSAMAEAQALVSAHIGIAPLRADDWSRGKCALKVLQYMAAGLPVVSSDAGANAEVILDGQTGFLVGDVASWEERIVLLAKDAILRNRFGAEGRRRVQADYSVERVFPRMCDIFKALA